ERVPFRTGDGQVAEDGEFLAGGRIAQPYGVPLRPDGDELVVGGRTCHGGAPVPVQILARHHGAGSVELNGRFDLPAAQGAVVADCQEALLVPKERDRRAALAELCQDLARGEVPERDASGGARGQGVALARQRGQPEAGGLERVLAFYCLSPGNVPLRDACLACR